MIFHRLHFFFLFHEGETDRITRCDTSSDICSGISLVTQFLLPFGARIRAKFTALPGNNIPRLSNRTFDFCSHLHKKANSGCLNLFQCLLMLKWFSLYLYLTVITLPPVESTIRMAKWLSTNPEEKHGYI